MKKKLVAIATGASMIGMALMPVAGLAQSSLYSFTSESPPLAGGDEMGVDAAGESFWFLDKFEKVVRVYDSAFNLTASVSAVVAGDSPTVALHSFEVDPSGTRAVMLVSQGGGTGIVQLRQVDASGAQNLTTLPQNAAGTLSVLPSTGEIYLFYPPGEEVRVYNASGIYQYSISSPSAECRYSLNEAATSLFPSTWVYINSCNKVVHLGPTGQFFGSFDYNGIYSSVDGLAFDDRTAHILVLASERHADPGIYTFDTIGRELDFFTSPGSGPGQWGDVAGIDFAAGNLYVYDDISSTVEIWGEPTGPELQACAEEALAAMGIAPGTYPEMDAALDASCEDGNEDDDGLTIIEPGDVPNNYKLSCPESLVIAEGAEIGQNNIGSNDCSNQLFLGNGSIVNGNVLKTEDVWVAGTGNSITGNVNHSVSLHIGPGADLHIGGSVNDLQTLTVGTGGYLYVDRDMDIWVDTINAGTVEVGRTLYCNGLSGVPTQQGDTFADDDQCPYISAGPLAGGFTAWIYAAIVAILGFGAALIIEERGKKKA